MMYPVRGHTDETLTLTQMLLMIHFMNHPDRLQDSNITVSQFIHKEHGKWCFCFPRASKELWLCHFEKKFMPRDRETADNFKVTQDKFWKENTRDLQTSTSTRETLSDVNFFPFVMACLDTRTTKSHSRPLWMNRFCFILATFCLLSIPYRSFLFSKGRKVTWDITKHYSILDPTRFSSEPMDSLKHSKDPMMVRVQELSKNTDVVPTQKPQDAPVPTEQMLLAVCPPGVSPGQWIQVPGPYGRLYNVQVPAGISPGQQFEWRMAPAARWR